MQIPCTNQRLKVHFHSVDLIRYKRVSVKDCANESKRLQSSNTWCPSDATSTRELAGSQLCKIGN